MIWHARTIAIRCVCVSVCFERRGASQPRRAGRVCAVHARRAVQVPRAVASGGLPAEGSERAPHALPRRGGAPAGAVRTHPGRAAAQPTGQPQDPRPVRDTIPDGGFAKDSLRFTLTHFVISMAFEDGWSEIDAREHPGRSNASQRTTPKPAPYPRRRILTGQI